MDTRLLKFKEYKRKQRDIFIDLEEMEQLHT